MSFKRKILAIAASLPLIAGLGAASALSASAATPSCGSNCIDVFSKNFSASFHHPLFVMDVYKQAQNVGQPIILFRTSNSDPAEDFTLGAEGQVSDFFQAGLVSSSLNLHYGCGYNINEAKCTGINPVTGIPYPDDYALEIEYAPFGADTGLCVGLASGATLNEKVTLQACGVSSKTVWVVDTVDSCPSNSLYSAELPVINGSDTNFSHPLVLDYPASGYPTDLPRPQLFVGGLTGFSQSSGSGPCGTGSIVGPDSNQLWTATAGVLP